MVLAGREFGRGVWLVVLASGWLAGIITGVYIAVPAPAWLILAVPALGSGVAFWGRQEMRLLSLTFLCLCLGAWHSTLDNPANDQQAISRFIRHKGVEIQGTLADEPHLENQSTLLLVEVQSISLDKGQNWLQAHGSIQAQIRGATFDDPYGPHYGKAIQLNGTLLPAPSYAGPAILASMDFPGLLITGDDGNPLLSWLYHLRITLSSNILRALPQPYSGLMIALFLSLRTPAIQPLLPAFNASGVAHLLAPSGFKITLFSGLIRQGTGWFLPAPQKGLLPAQRRRGNPRRWLQTGLLMLSIVIYTVLSGAGPAALRAGIMGLLLVMAPRLGRFYNAYTALALTAWLLSLASPMILWESSFQLSFTGTLGILLLTPYCQRGFAWLNHLPAGHALAEILAVTLAAQISTFPLTALDFQQISLIALVANCLTVPLLGTVLALGTLISLGGFLSPQVLLPTGWLAWPLLWYIKSVICWCADLPEASITVNTFHPLLAWAYYALLTGLLTWLWLSHQPARQTKPLSQPSHIVSLHMRILLQGGIAIVILLTTSLLALQGEGNNGSLSITELGGGVAEQGIALLLHTPDGKLALIDEGADSTTLTDTLDAHLPFWQRSLDLVILTDTDAANLAALQDIVIRYQVARVIDAGMLHPDRAYALWRRTLDERHLPYSQVRQGALVSLGKQTSFQVLWPPAQLHKSNSEIHDNALALRLLAPGLHMLFLGTVALSSYALSHVLTGLSPAYRENAIVQISNISGTALPQMLPVLLQSIHPTLLLITQMPGQNSKKSTPSSGFPEGPWQTFNTAQTSGIIVQSNAQGWKVQPG